MFTRKQLKPEEIQFLYTCRRLPARLNTGETAALLGFSEHDIPTLIVGKMIEPLGRPSPNAPKYFAAADVIARSSDREWLSKATRAIANHWRSKNERRNSQSLT